MPADFFRVVRGYEIVSEDSTTLIQIITATAAPDAQADAIAAPIGSLWIVNGGTQSTTRLYQKFRDEFDSKQDWRDVTQSLNWRDPVEVRENTTTTLPTGTPGNPVVVDGSSISNGERVLFSNLTATAATDTIQSSVAFTGANEAIAGAHANLYFTVSTNGGAPIEYSITTAGSTDFDTIASLMTTAWGLGTVTWDDANDQFLFTTTMTGSSASVEAHRATATTPGLFDQIETDQTTVLTEEVGVLGIGADIYVYDQPSGTFYLDPAQSATDGDAVFVQAGTFADRSYFYNGTMWVEFGSGTAAEEGFIRQFIGKDAAGLEAPSYENPTETPATSEPATRDPFTDATGQGTAAASNGYVVNETDNLELAVAKLNAEFFQNNRHLYATGVTSLVDTLPTWVDGAKWIVRIEQGARVRQFEVHATTDGTNVDYSLFAGLVIGGGAITGQSIVVTVSTGSLVLTVSTTAASTFQIRRMATVGPAGTGGVTGLTGALHVLA